MSRRIAIQMDPLDSIKPHSDTTLLLGVEAIRRGYEVFVYQPAGLSFREGEVLARGQRVSLRSDPDDHYTSHEDKTINLREVDVVLMRQDPPFDMAYVTATHLLEMLAPDVLVVNDPAAVRNSPEKLFMFNFPEFVPPTLISRDAEEIAAFRDKHTDIVIKPLYGYAGHSVFKLGKDDTNLNSLLETLFSISREPIIAQRFLPEIRTMDKRILIIDGKVTAVMGRVAAEGDIRVNMRVGGHGVETKPTPRDLAIGETVGEALKEQGILLAGLDVIGEYLVEINVTCPTGLIRSNALYGLTQERDFWDAVEKRLG